MNQETKNVLRWVAVLPGALAAGFLATFPLHWMLYFTLAKGETISGMNIDPIEYTIYPFVIAITFILAGFKIAPKHKFQTSAVLATLWIISFFVIFIFASELEPKFGLRGVLSLAGALLGLYIALRQSKKPAQG